MVWVCTQCPFRTRELVKAEKHHATTGHTLTTR